MEFKKRKPLIILISGKAQSGKSTLANYIKEIYEQKENKVIISPYTKYLKLYIENITNKKIDELNKPRDLLQEVSSKIIKGDLGKKNFFIERQIEDIEIYSYFADIIIIPDVRFEEEITNIKEKYNDTISIRVTRENYISTLTEKQQNDITEIALNNYNNYDYEVKNDFNTNLKKIAKEIITKIEERRINHE